MKLLLIITSMIFSFTFLYTNHPLAMGLVLLIQTMFISMITGLLSQSFWFSYILFLIFLGGMLVLFIYIASLASNEMFSMSTKLLIFTTPMMLIMLMMFTPLMFPTFQNQETNMFTIMFNNMSIPLIKLYNQPTSIITIMLATYLLLTLIVVVKITNIFKGPLRQMN